MTALSQRWLHASKLVQTLSRMSPRPRISTFWTPITSFGASIARGTITNDELVDARRIASGISLQRMFLHPDYNSFATGLFSHYAFFEAQARKEVYHDLLGPRLHFRPNEIGRRLERRDN